MGGIRTITKRVQCYEDYTVDIYGRVFSHKQRKGYLKYKNSNGYAVVTLHNGEGRKNFKVHRLVALAFIDNPKKKPCVNHLDGNRMNNSLDNLEWVTHKENKAHSINVLKTSISGRKSNFSKLNENSENAIKYLKTKVSTEDLCLAFNIHRATIESIK